VQLVSESKGYLVERPFLHERLSEFAQILWPPFNRRRSGVEGSELTIILPTHNRAELAKAQLRFLEASAVRHRVIVADSSDVIDEELRKACTGRVQYRRFKPTTELGPKLAAVARSVTTRYVATVPDDDVCFPHTIDACLDYLQCHPDYVAAQGYVLRYGAVETRLDIHSLLWFIPSIAQTTPLQRLYELMRRYQNFFWAVFRTDAYILASKASEAAKGGLFQELAICATMALLGKFARLPMIHTLLGEEASFVPPTGAHPTFWLLHDSASFFHAYGRYRDRLVSLLRKLSGKASARQDNDLAHTIDVIHGCYFGREVDTGIINHTAELLIGDRTDPPQGEKPVQPKPTIEPDDAVHLSAIPGRSYIWRNAVLNAEPKSEISISNEEIARVEAALDDYLCSVGSAAGRAGKCLTEDSRQRYPS
jgi:glycosyltransferase domain-containing protein